MVSGCNFFFFFSLSVGKEDSDCTIEINGKQMMLFIWNDGGTMFPALELSKVDNKLVALE